jgi:hypothetical protein
LEAPGEAKAERHGWQMITMITANAH